MDECVAEVPGRGEPAATVRTGRGFATAGWRESGRHGLAPGRPRDRIGRHSACQDSQAVAAPPAAAAAGVTADESSCSSDTGGSPGGMAAAGSCASAAARCFLAAVGFLGAAPLAGVVFLAAFPGRSSWPRSLQPSCLQRGSPTCRCPFRLYRPARRRAGRLRTSPAPRPRRCAAPPGPSPPRSTAACVPCRSTCAPTSGRGTGARPRLQGPPACEAPWQPRFPPQSGAARAAVPPRARGRRP